MEIGIIAAACALSSRAGAGVMKNPLAAKYCPWSALGSLVANWYENPCSGSFLYFKEQ